MQIAAESSKIKTIQQEVERAAQERRGDRPAAVVVTGLPWPPPPSTMQMMRAREIELFTAVKTKIEHARSPSCSNVTLHSFQFQLQKSKDTFFVCFGRERLSRPRNLYLARC